MRRILLTAAVVCTPLTLAGQQSTPPKTEQQILDTPGAVRFEAVERYQAALLGTGPVQLRLGTAATLRVVPTDHLTLPLVIDPTEATNTSVAALSASVQWDAQRLTLDSVTTGTFGSLQVNDGEAASGTLALSVFSAEGTTAVTTIATLHFTASGAPGGTTIFLVPTQMGDAAGTSLLRQALVRPVAACVVPPGNWGDANDDGQVNIIDAQQIARRSIALSVLRPAVVTSQGDVNADSTVDIIDAQQVARASIGLSAATRIGTPVFVIPPVFSLQLGTLPGALGIGEAAPLVASPRASSGLPLDGCVPVTWSSESPTVAGVDTTGIVRGLTTGETTITASAGGASGTITVTTINRATVVTGFTVVDGPEIAHYPAVQTGQPVRIRVTNEFGTGVGGIPVTVAYSGGTALIGTVEATRLFGASTAPITAVTDGTGIAIVRLWGGSTAPATGEVTVTIPGQEPTLLTVTTVLSRKGEHTCMADSWTLRCWGDNSRGQLGTGTTISSATPVPVALGGISLGASSSVSQEGFGDHTCLTDASGDAYCWGSNTTGQIGDSTYTDRTVPTRVRTSLKFTKVVTGGEHSCGLTTLGEIWCWGYNWAGQLGDSTFSNRRSIPVRTAAPSGVVFNDISAGTNHTCGGSTSGAWYCWGVNVSGQLGDGTTLSSPTPVAVAGGTPFVQVVGGEAHSCGRTAAGAASCWGDPSSGALGDGRLTGTLPQVSPVAVVNGTDFTYLYAGYYRTCGIKADFTTWCWGFNNDGQLGDGSTVTRGTPLLIPFTGYALKMGGTAFTGSGQTTCGLTNASQQVFCWGSNLSGKLGTGTDFNTPILTPQLIARAGAPPGVAAAITPLFPEAGIATGPAGATSPDGGQMLVRDALGAPVVNQPVTYTILTGGLRFGTSDTTITTLTDTAGVASTGPLALGTTLGLISLRASIPVTAPNGQAALARFVFVGRIVPSGGSLVKLMGDSVLVTTVNDRNRVPIKVRVEAPDGTPVAGAQARVSTASPADGSFGGANTLLLEADAQGIVTLEAAQWTLGTGAASTIFISSDGGPDVTFTRFKSVLNAAQPLTSCELTAAGVAYCWGYGAFGAVGNGANTNSVTTPTLVAGSLSFTQLASGGAPHKCGLVGTNAYCWGSNNAGQLGDGSRTNRNVPTLVSGGLAFAQIATGGATTCALTIAGELYCWGWSGTAGFGLGDEQRGRPFPFPVAITTPQAFTKITLADDAVCGLTSSGELWCRGDGLNGWNLDGSTALRTTFTRAEGGPWSDVSASYLGICAIAQADGRAHCAGLEQSSGSLGSGAPVPGLRARLSPVSSTVSYASIDAFHFGACARTAEGDTDCWGSNHFGQTGTGSPATAVFVPTRIAGVRFATLRPMAFRTLCGKVTSGFLYCWGQNGNGQLGTGAASSAVNGIPVSIVSWPDGPSAGTAVSMTAITPTSGSAIVGTPFAPAPAVVVRDRTGAVTSGVPVTFTLLSGEAVLSGASATTDASGIASLGALFIGNTPGLVTVRASVPGLPSLYFRITSIPQASSLSFATNATQYVFDYETTSRNPLSVRVLDGNGNPIASYPVTYAVTAGNGTLAGGTSAVALTNASGIASFQNWSTPTGTAGTYTITASASGLAPVTFTMIKQQNYGGRTTCRMGNDAAYCWGDNNRGEAGNGTTSAQLTPAVVTGGVPFVSLAEGNRSYHQCGLTAAGVAYCWGDNQAGELGDGTRTASTSPVAVSGGLTFAKLFKGIASTCGLTAGTSQLYCWGWTSHSRLGDGAVADIRTVPTLVNTNGLTFTSVALALEGTCGLTATRGVHCWSNTNSTILGEVSAVREVPSTTPFAGLSATQISAGDRAFCATTSDGRIVCWGNDNTFGQLGNGTTSASPTPIAIVGLPSGIVMREVRFSGWTSACAISTDGRLFCWGSNTFGQVGDGTTTNRFFPTQVGFGITFSAFHPVGADVRQCATATNGNSYCWGSAPLGDGTFTASTVPIAIVLPQVPLP